MKPTLILGFFMLSVFVGLAFVSLFTDLFEFFLPGDRKYYFAGVLLLYATLRAFRLKRAIAADKNQAT